MHEGWLMVRGHLPKVKRWLQGINSTQSYFSIQLFHLWPSGSNCVLIPEGFSGNNGEGSAIHSSWPWIASWVRGFSAEGQVPQTASLCPSILQRGCSLHPQAAWHTGSSADHEGSPTWSLLCPRNSRPHLAWQLAKTEGPPIWGRQRNPSSCH